MDLNCPITRSNLLAFKGEYKKAVEILQEHTKDQITAELTEAYLKLERCFIQIDDEKQAKTSAQKAASCFKLQQQPPFTTAQFLFSQALRELQNDKTPQAQINELLQKAVQQFDTANIPCHQYLQANYLLGKNFMRAENFELAHKYYSDARAVLDRIMTQNLTNSQLSVENTADQQLLTQSLLKEKQFCGTFGKELDVQIKFVGANTAEAEEEEFGGDEDSDDFEDAVVNEVAEDDDEGKD